MPVADAGSPRCFPSWSWSIWSAAHARDAPTVSPAYWTSPPETATVLKADPSFIRVFGIADKHSGEPGYASEPIDFLPARDPLDWSLPAAWGLSGSAGKTPMISRRLLDYFDHVRSGRLDIESVSHVVTGRNMKHRFCPTCPWVRGSSIATTSCSLERD